MDDAIEPNEEGTGNALDALGPLGVGEKARFAFRTPQAFPGQPVLHANDLPCFLRRVVDAQRHDPCLAFPILPMSIPGDFIGIFLIRLNAYLAR